MAYDYDLVVIGGGAAGLTGSGLGATLGAKTLMVESERLGGDCTWYGCVPSKALLKAGKVAHTVRRANAAGIVTSEVEVSFEHVMGELDRIREEIYHDADRPEIYEERGVEVAFGHASFMDPHTVSIENEEGTRSVSSRYFLIATGAKAFVPPIPGIDNVSYLTNETLFELKSQPSSLAIVGGGPIGCEMAQSFSRLGTEVTVIDMGERILSNDDEELASILHEQLRKEGVSFELGAGVKKFEKKDSGIAITIERDGTSSVVEAESVLMATGRRANVKGLNLEAAGVTVDKGVVVNDKCRTNVKHIYASGDVTGRYQFTHMSEHMSKVALTNMLTKFPMKIDSKHVPWVTFTEPEVAHVGATKKELEENGSSYVTYRFPYSRVDRALTDGVPEGVIKVYGRRRSGKILGVDIVGASAGELLGEFSVAMKNGVTLRNIADTIHAYPTFALGARRLADQWYIKNHTPLFARVLKTIFRYRGPVVEFEDGEIV